MANGIIIINKPQDWISSELALAERGSADANPLILAGGSSSLRHDLLRRSRRENGGKS